MGASQLDAIKARLARVERDLGNVELMLGEANDAAQVAALLARAGPGTPVLTVNLHCFALTRSVQPIIDGHRPMVVFLLPASGHDWMYAHR